MLSKEWILCPICGNKTRVRIRKDTELKNFPLYCPKCSRESLMNSSLNPPFEMGDQAKPKRCLEY